MDFCDRKICFRESTANNMFVITFITCETIDMLIGLIRRKSDTETLEIYKYFLSVRRCRLCRENFTSVKTKCNFLKLICSALINTADLLFKSFLNYCHFTIISKTIKLS